MKRKPHVEVIITKTKRRDGQLYSFTIDKPGPAKKETKLEYYTRSSSAKRAALTLLKAFRGKEWLGQWNCYIKGKKYLILFTRRSS